MIITDHSCIRVDTPAETLFAIAVYTDAGFPFWKTQIVLPTEADFLAGVWVCVAKGERTCAIADRALLRGMAYAENKYFKQVELPALWELLVEPDHIW